MKQSSEIEGLPWSQAAEAAVKKVPFFVRKRVRARVEKEARQAGLRRVSVADVKTTQARYLKGMSSEIKGYRIDACFGPGGCPNRANPGEGLLEKIEAELKRSDLLGFLKERVNGDLKFHHEFRISLADCPNACSQPQIKDIGIIGACTPAVGDEPCSECMACVETCKDQAVSLGAELPGPAIDFTRCLHCGQCIRKCPTGTLIETCRGFRVLLGGKLGRHPQLARELPGIFSEGEVVAIVKTCIAFYKTHSTRGQRFALLLSDDDFKHLASRFGKKS